MILALVVVVVLPSGLRAAADSDYQKVLSSFQREEADAVALVDAFISAYPEDARLPQMQVLRLSGLFDGGRYAELIADVQAESFVVSDEQREVVAYLLCGAQCLSGDYGAAVVTADRYFEKWSAGGFAQNVRYFKAVSLARMGFVKEVRALLEPMQAEDAEDFEFLDNALYELALLDFGVGDYQASIKRLEELLTWLFEAPLLVESKLLLAQNYTVVRQREEAEKCFLEALALVRESELPDLEQKVLFYLVDFYGRETVAGEVNARIAEAVPYYQEFFEKFPDSIYAAQVATVALPSLTSVGELRQGVERLESVVRRYCSSGREEGLQRAASSLVWKKLAMGVTAPQLRKELEQESASVFSAVMWHALSKVYEAGVSQSRTKWGQQLRFRMLREGCFAQVVRGSLEQNLPAYLRADLGWRFLENANFPEKARSEFQCAQMTQNGELKQLAQIGEMASLALLGGEQNLLRSQQSLSQLIDGAEAYPDVREKGMFHLAKVMNLRGDCSGLSGLAYRYLYEEKFNSERAEMNFFLAKSYDEQQMVEESIAQYTKIFATYIKNVEISAPSVERLTLLTWQRNGKASSSEPSDRQIAYQLGHRYLGLLESVPTWRKELPEVKSALDEIAKNVELWERSGEVKSVETLLKELRKSRYKR